jgi:hypothetical protein
MSLSVFDSTPRDRDKNVIAPKRPALFVELAKRTV